MEDAIFTSVWDGGFQISTRCKVNMDTREVFNIEESGVDPDSVDCLDEEYITIGGVNYPVVNASYFSVEPYEFWFNK